VFYYLSLGKPHYLGYKLKPNSQAPKIGDIGKAQAREKDFQRSSFLSLLSKQKELVLQVIKMLKQWHR